MKVAHISTWRCKCGVADYTWNIVSRLSCKNRVFANIISPTHFTYIPGEDEPYVERIFVVHGWEGYWEADNTPIWDWKPDILHLQINCFLYQLPWINDTLYEAGKRGIKTVVTLHDGNLWPGFQWGNVNAAIAHWPSIMEMCPLPETKRFILPSGIPAGSVQLGSFGMGRNPHGQIKEIVESVGMRFTWHDPVTQGWIPQEALLSFLRGLDGIVLWYPHTDTGGASSALRVALAARRPIFVSNTSWFHDATSPLVKKFDTLDQFKEGIQEYYRDPMIDNFKSEEVARLHEDVYKEVLGM
tara:strand:+ start:1706 stop:2602 length:897 start_codon:yes stop_codon:yes gene_type:complete